VPLWDALHVYYVNRFEIDSNCKVEDNPFACSVSAFRAWDARIGGRWFGKVVDGEFRGPTEHLLGYFKLTSQQRNSLIFNPTTIYLFITDQLPILYQET
jgi:hypothetical protein